MSLPASYLIDCIVGARPNFVKIAPILRAIADRWALNARLIHTGQHYDRSMNGVLFEDLQIPSPDINLEVGSGTGTEQTARIMMGLEPVLRARRPHMVLVVGDVNSTLAAALASARLGIPVAHVEAGLRSYDRTMPEELNRILTDQISDLLLATERSAVANLLREGIDGRRIKLVGNVMIDALIPSLKLAVPAQRTFAERKAPPVFADLATRGFGFVTLHRPSNVDERDQLANLMAALGEIARTLPLVFAVHPRTRAVIAEWRLENRIREAPILLTPPLSYLSTIGLLREAALVITDSGGIQDETTALGVPCLTVRESTERPVTVVEGTNTLVGRSPSALIEAAADVLESGGKRGRVPELWDGHAAPRIVDAIEHFLGGGADRPAPAIATPGQT